MLLSEICSEKKNNQKNQPQSTLLLLYQISADTNAMEQDLGSDKIRIGWAAAIPSTEESLLVALMVCSATYGRQPGLCHIKQVLLPIFVTQRKLQHY